MPRPLQQFSCGPHSPQRARDQSALVLPFRSSGVDEPQYTPEWQHLGAAAPRGIERRSSLHASSLNTRPRSQIFSVPALELWGFPKAGAQKRRILTPDQHKNRRKSSQNAHKMCTNHRNYHLTMLQCVLLNCVVLHDGWRKMIMVVLDSTSASPNNYVMMQAHMRS